MLSGLECEYRQACLSRRDHPRSRFRFGIVEDETVEEVFQRCFLGWRASVGRLSFLVEPTLVADSDAMGVVVAVVSTLLAFWTAGIDHAILRDVIVVTDGVETTGFVAGF